MFCLGKNIRPSWIEWGCLEDHRKAFHFCGSGYSFTSSIPDTCLREWKLSGWASTLRISCNWSCILMVSFSLPSYDIILVILQWRLELGWSLLCIPCSRWREKFPNFLAFFITSGVSRAPASSGHLQPRQHRALVARLHMASLAKEMHNWPSSGVQMQRYVLGST